MRPIVDRDRIAPGEDAAMGDRDPRALVDPERAQALALPRATSATQSTATISARRRDGSRSSVMRRHGAARRRDLIATGSHYKCAPDCEDYRAG